MAASLVAGRWGGGTTAGLMLAWLAGVAVHLQLPQLPGAVTLGAVGLSALVLLVMATLLRHGRWLVVPALALLAFGWAGVLAHLRLTDVLPAELEGRDVELTGVVATLPRTTADGVRFVLDVEQARWRGEAVVVPRRVSLGWYRSGDELGAGLAALGELRAGQRWRLTARLRQPHGSINPHGFDHELWLFERGIRATGYVRASASTPPAQLLGDADGHAVQRARQRVRDALFARVDDAGAAGVLAGLAIGDQTAIERDDWDVFRRSGTAHLMAISGLHVTMFAWAAGGLIGAAWRRSPRLALSWPAPVAARWGGVAVAAAYAAFAGWGVPAQRTVWMLAVAAALGSGGRRWPWPLVLGAAAVAVTVADPWALLRPGFWLSFVAVGVLLASEPVVPAPRAAADGAMARAGMALRRAMLTQLVATVGLAPLTLVLFQQVSLVGLLANAVAIPLVTLVITPLALGGIVLADLWDLAAWAVKGLTSMLERLTAWPAAVWTASAAPVWAVATGLTAALLAVAPLPASLRWLALPLLLPLLWPPTVSPTPGRFELLAADVGQGSAVLVRTHGHALLFDTGAQYGRDSDAGARVLVPLLQALGVRRLDALVLSHGDNDHVGGAAAVRSVVPVTELISSLSEAHPLRHRDTTPHRRCDAGQRWRWDGVDFELLHPPADDHARPLPSNALSCVLRVVDGTGRSALLTGDIEAAQEAALVARHGPSLRSEVLLVPHHGSRTSSSATLLDAVQPRHAVVQAGYRNRFGHPAPEVLARYAVRGIEVVRTDRCGAWAWRVDGTATCERAQRRRYWQWQPPPTTMAADGSPPS